MVRRPSGDVAITAEGGGPDRPYVQSLERNGVPLLRPWLAESFALHGGRLDFSLGSAPNRSWGAAPHWSAALVRSRVSSGGAGTTFIG